MNSAKVNTGLALIWPASSDRSRHELNKESNDYVSPEFWPDVPLPPETKEFEDLRKLDLIEEKMARSKMRPRAENGYSATLRIMVSVGILCVVSGFIVAIIAPGRISSSLFLLGVLLLSATGWLARR